ncbi:MAG: hypothetical protein M3422_06275 [Actinomycetota bacterium]|nr:hypothetical protein [Actinomycetota bacterium]
MRAESTYDELLEIPRGRGMLANDVAERIGPGLRVACGVTPEDSPAVVRRKVGDRLTELCGRLPTDLRISVLAALALHPEADHQFMQERMGWAARQINRDHPRAAIRRMKVGFGIIAEQLDDLVDDPRINQGWHIGSLRALLRMDVDPPQLLEERTIVATADGLEEVELRFSAHGKGGDKDAPITASIMYGGEITGSDSVVPSHRTFALRLPAPLRSGEQHEYGVRFTARPRAVMPPFYVLTPLQPCAKFSLRVRFGPDVPKQIWRVDGIPPRAIDDFASDDALVSADRFGEVALEFSRLHQGLSYGVRWAAL